MLFKLVCYCDFGNVLAVYTHYGQHALYGHKSPSNKKIMLFKLYSFYAFSTSIHIPNIGNCICCFGMLFIVILAML